MASHSNDNAATERTARDAAAQIVRVLQDAGYVAYFAGGCVRDMLLGEAAADYDVATDATPEQVLKHFLSARVVGEAFGVALVRMYRHDVEVDWGGMDVEVAPAEVGHSTVGMWLYVDDVDTLYKRAVDAGAEVIDELMDAFWGDCMGKVKDPFGHAWALASHVEDVPPAEMERRQEEWFASMGDDE